MPDTPPPQFPAARPDCPMREELVNHDASNFSRDDAAPEPSSTVSYPPSFVESLAQAASESSLERNRLVSVNNGLVSVIHRKDSAVRLLIEALPLILQDAPPSFVENLLPTLQTFSQTYNDPSPT